MQQFHNPKIADYDDFLNVEQVIEDIAMDTELALDEDYNNGDIRNLEESDKMDMLEDRHNEYLQRQEGRVW